MELLIALGLAVIGVVAYLSWNLRPQRARAARAVLRADFTRAIADRRESEGP